MGITKNITTHELCEQRIAELESMLSAANERANYEGIRAEGWKLQANAERKAREEAEEHVEQSARDYQKLVDRLRVRRERADAAEIDAKRLKHLHDDPKRAQAYFWNYQGRKERNAAIDAALLVTHCD